MKQLLRFLMVALPMLLLLSCETMTKYNLGNGYFLIADKETPANSKVAHGKEDNFEDVILGEILDYDIDNDFILIHRKVTDQARSIFEESNLWKKQLGEPDQYWIIEKKYDGIHGPMNLKEYEIKRKELGISPGVKIRK